MPLIRVDTRPLFAELRLGLVELLGAAGPDDWDRPTVCEGWTVHDLVAHLIGVDLANVARRRDGHAVALPPGGLAAFNDQWVDSCRRLSAVELRAMVDLASGWFADWAETTDPDAAAEAPSWAGAGAAPLWLDVAREYTERWVHQQQLREAIGRPGLDSARFVAPVITTFVHALPVALAPHDAPAGTTVVYAVTGDGGGTWRVERGPDGWDLLPGDTADCAARVTTDVVSAWQRMSDRPVAAPEIVGDPVLGAAVARARSVIV